MNICILIILDIQISAKATHGVQHLMSVHAERFSQKPGHTRATTKETRPHIYCQDADPDQINWNKGALAAWSNVVSLYQAQCERSPQRITRQCQPPLCLSLWGEQSTRGVKTALRHFWHLSQARWKFDVRTHQTPNYQTHTDMPRKCGGRCGCQLIGGITVFAHYHVLTLLMKGRTGVRTVVGNLFGCTSLTSLTVMKGSWCYIWNWLCQHYHIQLLYSIIFPEFEIPSYFIYICAD